MAKWADYGISGVRYNTAKTHIEKVEVRVDNGESFGPVEEMSRAKVVSLIEQRKTFVTIVKNASNDKWSLGAPVKILPVTTDFLKTVADSKASDNLENLPTF